MLAWDHLQRVFACCAKFGWNWQCTFENMRVSILCVWLENAYSRPFCEVFGGKMEKMKTFSVLFL